MDQETQRHIKRLDRELGNLHREDRLLRERIASASGDQGSGFYSQGVLNGILTPGDGIEGGGTFPGTVILSVDLADTWSGMEFSGGELCVDLDAAFIWTNSHTWDAGVGNSPVLALVGGSNDDTASIFLDDDAVAGNSDLVLKLVAADEDSQLIIRDSADVDIAAIRGDTVLQFLKGDTGVIAGAAPDYMVQVRGGATEATSAYFNMYGTGFDGWEDYEGDFEITANTVGGHGWTRFFTYDGDVTWTPTLTIRGDTGRTIVETLIYGHVKSVTADGELGNGPVEVGENVGFGGTMEIGPSSRLYEETVVY